MIGALADHDVESSLIRIVDRNVLPGVQTDEGSGDARPEQLIKVADPLPRRH